jgi:hypothetical protein
LDAAAELILAAGWILGHDDRFRANEVPSNAEKHPRRRSEL